jgi:predicted nucleotidyltransferase
MKRGKPDKYLSEYIKYCKNKLKDLFLGIIIYGSYVDKNFDTEKSDYDIFVIIKNYKNEKLIEEFRTETNDRYDKITLQYITTFKKLKEKVDSGGWAVYIALIHTGRVIYSTPKSRIFFKNIAKKGIDIKKAIERYVSEKNKEELKACKNLDSWYAIKWPYASIRKRLYLISFARFGKSPFDFLKDLNLNKDLFLGKDIKGFKLLHKMYVKRKCIHEKKDRRKFVSLMKKVNKEVEKLAKA